MNQLIASYLKSTNNLNHKDDFENAYVSHPDYPSLLAITDSLTQNDIENIAANVPFKHIDQLPKKFIAELFTDKKDYYLVSKVENYFALENEKGIKSKVSLTELENYWTGIILIIEENENHFHKTTVRKSSYLFPLFLISISILHIVESNPALTEIAVLFLSSLGLFVSVEIIKTYFSNSNEAESKFCSANKNFSCKSIINSKSYSFSKYVEFVDLPIIFFSIAFLTQVLSLNVLFYQGFVSVLAIPFLLYSIYLQEFVLKKWCLLCLLVALIIGAIAALFLITYSNQEANYQNLISLLILSIIVVTAWFLAKNFLKKSKENLQKLNALLRFKRNENVFTKIATPIENKVGFDLLEKIIIGNEDAKNTITLFLSPSCPHCHTAYKTATELVIKYDQKLKLEICFNLNINNQENPFIDVARTILHMYNTKRNFKEALDDWHIKNMPLEQWQKKWFLIQDFSTENIQIQNQFEWCIDNDFNYAPIKFFNSYLLHGVYEINELFYFFEE